MPTEVVDDSNTAAPPIKQEQCDSSSDTAAPEGGNNYSCRAVLNDCRSDQSKYVMTLFAMDVGLGNEKSHSQRLEELKCTGSVKRKDVRVTSEVLNDEICCCERFQGALKPRQPNNWVNATATQAFCCLCFFHFDEYMLEKLQATV